MLDGGVRFNILPCRQVMEDALGRLLSAVVVEANISWDSFRREGIGSVIRQRLHCRRNRAGVRPVRR